MTLLWILAAIVPVGASGYAGARLQRSRDLRAFAADVAAVTPAPPAPCR
ncbi:hypothetical protein ACWKSP_32490 [Micromonosporaceae bacterium Da 78-11]